MNNGVTIRNNNKQQNDQNALIKQLQETIAQLTQRLVKLEGNEQQHPPISSGNNDTNTILLGIQDQLKAINGRLDGVEAKMALNSGDASAVEEKERQRSVVLIGLQESNEGKPSARVAADKNAVEEVLDELGIEVEPSAVYRMGRRDDPNRRGPRLMKVVFPASTYLRRTLGAWKRCRMEMKEEDRWKRLIIRPSLTKEQLEEERKVRAERQQQHNGKDF